MHFFDSPYPVVILAAAFSLAAVFVYFGVKRKSRTRRLLRAQWGEQPERRFSAGDLAGIRSQAAFLAGDRGFGVDDITWSDLDMDRLYASSNGTLTDAGDAALYLLLRNPLQDAESLRRRAEAMDWAVREEARREELKLLLYRLGHTGTMDLPLLFGQDRFDSRKRALHLGLSLGLVALILLCAVGVWPALIPAVVLAGVNVVISLRSRAETGRAFALYQTIPALLYTAKGVAQTDVPELEGMLIEMRNRLSHIKGILGNNLLNFYYSFNNQSVNNPLDVLLATFNVFFLIDVISMHNLSRQITRNREEIVGVFRLLGELDALIAAASFRETMPVRCLPELEAGKLTLHFEDAVHPLLKDAVPNSLDISGNVLLTGSNATGKSTFLKTVAMNAILAQSLCVCAASSWRGGFFRVFTSMALRDDLFSHESYFITEIKSLKRMLDSAAGEVPALCIVDEVLRGTNTGERIAAASEALRQFAREHCLCLAATHDIELTHILEGLFENMHFTETITEDGIAFDYKLRPGRSKSRNAIKLLELLGYGGELVEQASARLEAFEKTGRWGRVGEA